ncbi:MAG: VTT domain-containing protein [Acidobacteriia bacterium]|nr:VTT domain-containing protein [Terriglobia bacterium]
MIEVLRHYGYSFVFLAVFAENLGLPLPSFPIVLVAAALAGTLNLRVHWIVAVSVLAALAGDSIWYAIGRRRGRPMLRLLCSLSLGPDSCVSRTESLFEHYGGKSLLVAKFLPGLNTIAPPLAGMLKMSPLRFALLDLGGIGLWVTSAVLLGLGFRTEVEWIIAWLSAMGMTSVFVILVLLAGFVLLKWVDRRRFYRTLAKARISPQKLKERIDRGEELVVVDLRSDLRYEVESAKIPGALHIPPGEFEKRYREIPSGKPVVMYCT